MPTMQDAALARLLEFVRRHSPGHDAVIDAADPGGPAVTWLSWCRSSDLAGDTAWDFDVHVARTLAEARKHLGY